jgi:uncharacterized membrane protein YbhN (UPF0104 family)
VKRLLPALLASAVLIALLAAATQLRWSDVAGTLAALDRGEVALSFAVYAASFAGRGLRLAVLLPGAGSLAHLSSISARHIFLAVVLPFRSGEASLPLMLTAECGRPLHEGVSVLGLMRVLDLAAVAAWLLIGLALTGRLGAGDMTLRAAGVFVLLAGGLLLMPVVARRLAPLARSTRRPLAFAGRAAEHLAALRRGQLVLAALTSLATWAATYLACFLIVRAMSGAPEPLGPAAAAIDVPTSLVGTTGLHLSAVIPVSPLAGVGTWEAGWTAGYTFVGMGADAAATSGIVSHVVVFTFIALLGGAGWLLRGPRRAGPAGAAAAAR